MRSISSTSALVCAAAAGLAAAACGSKAGDGQDQGSAKAAAPAAPVAVPEAPPPEPPPPPPAGSAPAEHTGEHRWSLRLGGQDADAARSVAVDAAGNVYVTGYFSGEVDFGGGQPVAAAGLKDVFVASFDAAGAHRWSVTFGGPLEDEGQFVAVDADGNVYVTGSYAEGARFGELALENAGSYDFFLAKLTPEGAVTWVRKAGGRVEDRGYSVAVDRAGNPVVTGYFGDSADFGGGAIAAVGRADMFVVKYDPTGAHLWSRSIGSGEDDLGRGVAVDWQGNALVLGDFHSTVKVGAIEVRSVANADVLVAKYDPAGNALWAKRYGHDFHDFGVGIAVDRDGNAIVTGSFENTIDFGGGPRRGAGKKDLFVAKLTGRGEHVWSKVFGSADDDVGGGVAVDPFGNVALTGWFWKEVDFGGGALASAGKNDIVLAKLAPDGAHLWSRRYGGADGDFGRGVAVDGKGDIMAVGTYRFAVSFGGAELPYGEGGKIPRGDAFVARFGP